MKKKRGLKRIVVFLSVVFNRIDTNDILDIHKYFVKVTRHKIIFEIIQKVYMVLLISIVNASNHRKSLSFSNQKCLIQPTLVSVHPNE